MNVLEKIEINLTEAIANKGIEKHFECEFKPLDDLLSYPESHFVSASFTTSMFANDISVDFDGEISVTIDGICDFCAEPTTKTFTFPFVQTFYREGECDDAEYCYQGSKADLTKAIYDEIVLSLPMSFVCKEDCKGLCPKCGVNRNYGECKCGDEHENAFSILKNLKF